MGTRTTNGVLGRGDPLCAVRESDLPNDPST